MFNNKKIKELELRIEVLEERVRELVHKGREQSGEIDKIYLLFEQQAVNTQKPKPAPKPKFKPRKKKNGEENPKASE